MKFLSIFFVGFFFSILCLGEEIKRDDNSLKKLELVLPPAIEIGTPMPISISKEHLEKKSVNTKKQFLKIPKECKNVALKKKVSASIKEPIIGELAYLTDGDKDADEGFEVELSPGAQWIQIDLEESVAIYAIALWHYHRQKRVYNDVVICLSEDGAFKKNVQIVFNNDFDNSLKMGKGKDKSYIETNAGKEIPVAGIKARYVRFYSNGNSSDNGNHYIEAEIYGMPLKKEGKNIKKE